MRSPAYDLRWPPEILVRVATTHAEFDAMDTDEADAGYLSGRKGDAMPGSDVTDSFAHGWWIGMRDGGFRGPHPLDALTQRAWFTQKTHHEEMVLN